MFTIVENDMIAPHLHRIKVVAPLVAQARKPGQFVMVRLAEGEERIPLTIGDADIREGTISLFVQAIGSSTQKIVAVPVGGALRDVAGPLGMPTHIEKSGRVACIGGGVGTAVLFPMAKALAEAGNEVITIIGGRNKSLIILADELAAFSRQVRVTTDDGSMGSRGFVTDELETLIQTPGLSPDTVFAVGPLPMMRAVSELT
ncbi:MAG: sulfide/dihydroorotate dehydrogenase-like FAD/NAD-binding protein, partial [Desulfuromonadales bacterium]|nr:sulfide/dihydroorotate dehydrogenase-like FAD/NAD-binding protein [Desulfuromonadales bacterium]